LKLSDPRALGGGRLQSDRIPSDPGETEQEDAAVLDLRPVALGKIEHLADVAGVGHRIARMDRRHPRQR
jgi:hypothetical protein